MFAPNVNAIPPSRRNTKATHSYGSIIYGVLITVDLDSGDMDLDLNNDDNNLIGTVKSGNAHP